VEFDTLHLWNLGLAFLREGALLNLMEILMRNLRSLCAAALFAGSASFAFAADDTRVFVANLEGGNELPGLGDPDAFGVATITAISPGAICYSIVLQNAGAPTAAHIHAGGGGTAGAVSLILPVPAAPLPTRFANCVVAPGLITAIRNNPHNFYVNVHTAAFPAGAVRGQLH
jgi:CHRD domain